MAFTRDYLNEAIEAIDLLDHGLIERLVDALYHLRQNARLFILGVGGNAADALHAAADFRKLCGIEAYAATSNIAEITANTNDEGWDTTFHHYLRDSRLTADDMVMVLSVGGGSDRISVNITRGVEYAKFVGAMVVGIVGPHGGYTKELASICLHVPVEDPNLITSLTHSIQGLVLHLLFNHPRLTLT